MPEAEDEAEADWENVAPKPRRRMQADEDAVLRELPVPGSALPPHQPQCAQLFTHLPDNTMLRVCHGAHQVASGCVQCLVGTVCTAAALALCSKLHEFASSESQRLRLAVKCVWSLP